tara:strand:- start:34331 stop:35203 length:873 start_codon:yes stop_codon:yes gene_type:complete
LNESLGNTLILIGCAIWAVALSFFKIAERHIDSSQINLIKNSVGLVFVTGWMFFTGGWNPGDVDLAWQLMFASGVIGMAFGDVFFLSAIGRLGVGKATSMALLTPVLTLILEFFILDRSPSAGSFSGMFLVLIGVFYLHGPVKNISKEGFRLIFLACLCVAIAQVLARWSFDLDQDLSLGTSAFFRVFGGVIGMAFIMRKDLRSKYLSAISKGPHLKPLMIGAFLGTGIGICLYQSAAKLTTATQLSFLGTTTPIFAIPIAWIIAKEIPQKRVVVGALIAIVGVSLIFLL